MGNKGGGIEGGGEKGQEDRMGIEGGGEKSQVESMGIEGGGEKERGGVRWIGRGILMSGARQSQSQGGERSGRTEQGSNNKSSGEQNLRQTHRVEFTLSRLVRFINMKKSSNNNKSSGEQNL